MKLIIYFAISIIILSAFFAVRQSSLHGYVIANISSTLEAKEYEIESLKKNLDKSMESTQLLEAKLKEAEKKGEWDRLTTIDSPMQEYFELVRKSYAERPWWQDSTYEKQAQLAAQIAANAAGDAFWKKEEAKYSSKTGQNSYVVQADLLDALMNSAGINKSISDGEKLERILELLQHIKYENDLNNDFRFPLETLKLKSGDCDDFSIIAAAMLKRLGIKTAIVLVSGTEGVHSWIAVQGNFELQKYKLAGSKEEWMVVEPQFPYTRQSPEWFSKYPRILAYAIV